MGERGFPVGRRATRVWGSEAPLRVFNLIAIAAIIAVTFLTVTLAGPSAEGGDDAVADAALID